MSAPASRNPSDNGGRLSIEEFHNGLRILLNLDFDDLAKAGVFEVSQIDRWQQFQRDPFRFFIRTDEETADALWRLIQERMKRRAAA